MVNAVETMRTEKGADFDVDKYRVKVSFYIVEYQNPYEDLPPYVWHLERIFLSKSQAIGFVQRTLRNNPCDTEWRIMVQHDNSYPTVAYTFSNDGTVHKAKKGE